MLTSKEFVAKLESENEALFRASELQIKHYYENTTDKDELIDNFTGRMVNERMNMEEISREVAAMPASTPVEELTLLTKQAQDEAKHFGMVRDVIEHITGETLDVEAAIKAEEANPTAKGAALLEKYEAATDPLAMAAYQFIAEGRAEAVWNKMAECIEDTYVSSTYAKIAKDEGFHASIGARSLEQLATDTATQTRVLKLANQMRQDLFEVSCMNTKALPEAQKLIDEAYAV